MRYRRYPAYKESGVEWLGEVPAHWTIRRFKYLFMESSEKNLSSPVGEMLSVSGYRGIEPKQYDFESRKRTADEIEEYRVVRPGQLVVNTMWLNYAGLGVSDYEGYVSPAYRSYWISEDIDKRYAHHLLRSSTYVAGYTKHLQGIRPNSLQVPTDEFTSFPILLPSKEEQGSIAAFLDCEIAQIDALIAKLERLSAVLQEKRQALITHAVTKGLNPNAPMKDSGMEWLGEVPAHWQVKQLKHELASVTSGSRGWAENYADRGDIFLRIGNLTRDSIALDLSDIQYVNAPAGPEAERTRVQTGDLLISITADLGSVAVVPESLPIAYINQHIALARPLGKSTLPEWLGYQVLSSVGKAQLALQAYGGTKIQLSLEDIKTLRVQVPPEDEQTAILRYIKSHEQKTVELMDTARITIRKLMERRATLISAAVTGKIDVRC